MVSKNILLQGDDYSLFLDCLDFDESKEVVYLALDNPKEFSCFKTENADLQVTIGVSYEMMDALASVWEKKRAQFMLEKLLEEDQKEQMPLSGADKEHLREMGACVKPGAVSGLLRDVDVDKTVDDDASLRSAISVRQQKS